MAGLSCSLHVFYIFRCCELGEQRVAGGKTRSMLSILGVLVVIDVGSDGRFSAGWETTSAWNSRFRLDWACPSIIYKCQALFENLCSLIVFKASTPCFKAQPWSCWPKALDKYKKHYYSMSGPCVVHVATAEWVWQLGLAKEFPRAKNQSRVWETSRWLKSLSPRQRRLLCSCTDCTACGNGSPDCEGPV